jgi:hypothetical protein
MVCQILTYSLAVFIIKKKRGKDEDEKRVKRDKEEEEEEKEGKEEGRRRGEEEKEEEEVYELSLIIKLFYSCVYKKQALVMVPQATAAPLAANALERNPAMYVPLHSVQKSTFLHGLWGN